MTEPTAFPQPKARLLTRDRRQRQAVRRTYQVAIPGYPRAADSLWISDALAGRRGVMRSGYPGRAVRHKPRNGREFWRPHAKQKRPPLRAALGWLRRSFCASCALAFRARRRIANRGISLHFERCPWSAWTAQNWGISPA